MKYNIKGGTIVTPEYILQGAALTIEGDTIVDMGQPSEDADFELLLDDGDLVFPGLINAHDHLLGNYYPRVGTGPYINFKPWDNDLKSAPVYEERSRISNFDLYLLASYRNIISGVTTVSDHIPHSVNRDFIDKLPVRVQKDYSLQHECASYDLQWGDSLSEEHSRAVKNNIPFITHIEEGFDEESTLGIDILREMKALDEHTVLIHGIALSEEDIKHIAKAGAHLVTCPASNHFMFNVIADLKTMMRHKVNISLGTDSPMSGGLNLFDEMQMCRKLYQEKYKEELDDKELIRWVTVNPAKALRLPRLGRLEKGYLADILILRQGDKSNPYKSLANAWYNDVKMVLSEGQPLYGSRPEYEFFQHFNRHYQLMEINGEERILIGQPIDLYHRIWDNVNIKKVLPFFPVEVYQ